MRSAEEADARFFDAMFQVNPFGQMRVTQAALPLMRAQGRGEGRIVFTSSSIVWTPLPFMSHYAASKAALSAYVNALHTGVRPLGSLGQPREGASSAEGSGAAGPAAETYKPLFGSHVAKSAGNPMVHMPGDFAKAAARIMDVVRRKGIAAGKPWAARVALGSDRLGSVRRRCEDQPRLVDAREDLSSSTDRRGASGALGTALRNVVPRASEGNG